MTLAIGASLPDGAVLLTDSLLQLTSPAGFKALLYRSPRFEQLPGCSGAACISGHFRGGWGAPILHEGTIEAAANALLSDLALNGVSDRPYIDSDGQAHAPRGEFVAAGRSEDGTVRLVRASTLTGEGGALVPHGQLVMAGAASYFAQLAAPLMHVPPQTLEELAGRVLEAGRICITVAYAAILQAADLDEALERLEASGGRGPKPAIAPPLHVAQVTPFGVRTWRYDS